MFSLKLIANSDIFDIIQVIYTEIYTNKWLHTKACKSMHTYWRK